jgi:hypothetical protein
VDSTKHSFGSTKRKATDATNEVKGMAEGGMGQASKSTKQAAESTQQKINQAAGEVRSKADRVCLLFNCFLSSLPDIVSQD